MPEVKPRLRLGRLDAPALIGCGLLLVAVTVMAGWVAHVPMIAHPVSGAVMVLNTALGFALTGVALGAGSVLAPEQQRRWHTLLGGAVIVIAALVLLEHLAGVNLGIDWPELHRSPSDGNSHPGRMSPPTTLAFLLTGSVLVGMHRVRALWGGFLVQALTILVVVMGAMGSGSWLIDLHLVYHNYVFGGMSLTTGLGFTAAGTALWLTWRRMDWYRARTLIANEGQRISVNAGAVLAIMIAVSLLAGFAVMRHQLDEFARESLLEPLKSRVDLVRTTIELRVTPAAMIATRPTLLGLARKLGAQPGEAAALAQLRMAAESFLPLGFSAIAFESPDGSYWAGAGRFAENPALELGLSGVGPISLIWDDGFVMKARVPMVQGGETVGVLVAEQRLHALTKALRDSQDFAATGEIAVCGRRADGLWCFPGRGEPKAHAAVRSETFPMGRALAGETGVTIGRDAGDNYVIAAYGPVAGLGLGMVVKMDTVELYAPLRERMYLALVLMAAMVVTGALLLYWRIVPLARRIAVGEERLKLALDSSRSAVWDLDLRSGDIYLSEQWSVLMGGSPQATATTLQNLEKLVHPDDVALVRRKVLAALRGHALEYDVEQRIQTPAGIWLWIHSVGRVIERDRHGRAVRMTGVNTNITSNKEAQLAIEHHARHDAVTGLVNHSVFSDRLELAMARVRRVRARRPLLALLYVNIAAFRQINDNFGYATGSALLREYAQRLAGCVRATDTVSRLESDKFAILLEDLSAAEEGSAIAEKVLANMRAPFAVRSRQLGVKTNIGIAYYDGVQDITAEQLLGKAQYAMYEAYNESPDTFLAAT